MEIILISLSVISTLSTVCLFILIVIMNKAVNDLKNDVSTIKTDERIDLINIEAKALAMKINSLETVFYMNGDSTLDVNAPEWLISNKKVKKYFSPGKIERVENADDHSLTTFEYLDNRMVVSKTYINDILKYEIMHSEYGNPVSGQVFDDKENPIVKYSYDKFGQVSKDN